MTAKQGKPRKGVNRRFGLQITGTVTVDRTGQDSPDGGIHYIPYIRGGREGTNLIKLAYPAHLTICQVQYFSILVQLVVVAVVITLVRISCLALSTPVLKPPLSTNERNNNRNQKTCLTQHLRCLGFTHILYADRGTQYHDIHSVNRKSTQF